LAARGVEDALKILEGRWKLVILFHLFGGNRPSHRSPPGSAWVEYCLTNWGEALCPALDALLKWAASDPERPLGEAGADRQE
jgi:DNA-binding HxlR family transcriptional regulator